MSNIDIVWQNTDISPKYYLQNELYVLQYLLCNINTMVDNLPHEKYGGAYGKEILKALQDAHKHMARAYVNTQNNCCCLARKHMVYISYNL